MQSRFWIVTVSRISIRLVSWIGEIGIFKRLICNMKQQCTRSERKFFGEAFNLSKNNSHVLHGSDNNAIDSSTIHIATLYHLEQNKTRHNFTMYNSTTHYDYIYKSFILLTLYYTSFYLFILLFSNLFVFVFIFNLS